ncbi:ribonuclease H-like domain-containing protein [Tanacetum coccineum]
MIEADFELAQRLQAEEQGGTTIEERSRLFVELMNRRKKHFAKLKAKEIRRKPPTKAQKRNQMSTYLKNMARFKHSQLKSKSYDEIQKLFDKEMKRVNTFVDMNLEVVKGSETRIEESSKRAGGEVESNMLKKQKIDEHVEVKKDDQEEVEMKRNIEIVKDNEVEIDAIPLATKPLVIVEYQIDKDRRMGFFKLIKADGSSKDLLHRIISSLHLEFAMTDLGSLNYFLGISVARDSSGMFLSQKKYAVEILERAGMVNCNPNRTPVDTESKLGTIGDVVSDPTMYQSLASSLQYLTFTRPDNCHMLYFHNF